MYRNKQFLQQLNAEHYDIKSIGPIEITKFNTQKVNYEIKFKNIPQNFLDSIAPLRGNANERACGSSLLPSHKEIPRVQSRLSKNCRHTIARPLKISLFL